LSFLTDLWRLLFKKYGVSTLRLSPLFFSQMCLSASPIVNIVSFGSRWRRVADLRWSDFLPSLPHPVSVVAAPPINFPDIFFPSSTPLFPISTPPSPRPVGFDFPPIVATTSRLSHLHSPSHSPPVILFSLSYPPLLSLIASECLEQPRATGKRQYTSVALGDCLFPLPNSSPPFPSQTSTKRLMSYRPLIMTWR